ncbi:MAG: hypothetical protein ACREP2_03890 [Rhodanobacteraceae bacterium]
MNATWRIVKMPWLATVKSRGWWFLPVLLWATWTMIAGNDGGKLHGISWQRWGLVALTLAVATLWGGIANTLNLVHDAHVLRLPQIKRDADACLIVYALLSIVAPAVVLGAIFGHSLTLAALFWLAAAAALAARLMPAIWTIGLMIPAFMAYLLASTGRIHVPLPGEPGFLAWTIPLAVLLAAIAILRWRLLQRVDASNLSHWGLPGVLNTRQTHLNRLSGDTFFSTMAVGRGRHARKSAARQLHNIGPDHPVRSIRLALHRQMQPSDAFEVGKRALSPQQIFAIVLVSVALLTLLAQRYFTRATIVQFTPMILMVSGIVMAAYGTLFWRPIDARWRSHHQDRALLALLPELGAPVEVRRRLLRACVQPVVEWALRVALIAAVIFLLLRVPAILFLYVVLMAGGGTLMAAALIANMLGGKPFAHSVAHIFYLTGIVLAALTAFWGIQGFDSSAPMLRIPLIPAAVCFALWMLWWLFLAILAWRGWRLLALRAHPFLANPPE